MKLSWTRYSLDFKKPGGTSRGVLHEKDSYFLKCEHAGRVGWGECGILRGLSHDDRPGYEDRLDLLVQEVEALGQMSDLAQLEDRLLEWPSIRAGLEMLRLDYEARPAHVLYPSEFTDGEDLQPINGLVWMGSPDSMREQIDHLLERNFMVIKLKIGAIDWQEEYKLLQEIRKSYSSAELQVRVDANGAFKSLNEAKRKLDMLDDLRIHSIEQPIPPGRRREMAQLCQSSLMPVALDEELIGIHTAEAKAELLEAIRPNFIILKPSLLGGFKASEEWIEVAEQLGIGWWVTSALESNLGLNAIAQWNYTLNNMLASGLGTGSLYANNFPSPLYMEGGKIGFDPAGKWDLSALERKAEQSN